MGKRKKGKPVGIGRLIILLICAIVFFGCAGYVGLYVKQNRTAEKGFDAVAEKKDIGLEDVYSENSDLVAWVKIDDTHIDYPVMQTPEDPEFYLHRDFSREESEPGTPFVDEGSHIAVKGIDGDRVNTENWLIHGHNMKAGTMFHDLLKYEDKSFWEEQPEFSFDVITAVDGSKVTTRQGKCRIFAACRSRIKDKGEEGFRYYHCAGITDEKSFDEYVEGVSNEALYNTGIKPEYGDQLITLSTCAYHTDNGRFYIVGILNGSGGRSQ